MNERTHTAEAVAAALPEDRERPYTPDKHDRARPMTSAPGAPDAGRTRAAREPLARSDRVLIALFATVITGGVLGLTSINGHLLNLQEQIGGIQHQIGGMQQQINGLRGQINGLQQQIHGIRQDVQEMRQDIHSLSGRTTAVEERLDRIETVLRIHHGPLPGS